MQTHKNAPATLFPPRPESPAKRSFRDLATFKEGRVEVLEPGAVAKNYDGYRIVYGKDMKTNSSHYAYVKLADGMIEQNPTRKEIARFKRDVREAAKNDAELAGLLKILTL